MRNRHGFRAVICTWLVTAVIFLTASSGWCKNSLGASVSPNSILSTDVAALEKGFQLFVSGNWDKSPLTVTSSDRSVTIKATGSNTFGQHFYQLYKKTEGAAVITIKDNQGSTVTKTITVKKPEAAKTPLGFQITTQNGYADVSSLIVRQGYFLRVSGGVPVYKPSDSLGAITFNAYPAQPNIFFFSPVKTGTSVITVRDSAGAAVTRTVKLQGSPMSARFENSEIVKGGRYTHIIADGGVPPFTARASNNLVKIEGDGKNSIFKVVSGSSAGTVTVTVSDSQGGSASANLTILAQDSNITVGYEQTRYTNVPFNLTVNGGFPPYKITSSAGISFKETAVGKYQVTMSSTGGSITVNDSKGRGNTFQVTATALPGLPEVKGMKAADAANKIRASLSALQLVIKEEYESVGNNAAQNGLVLRTNPAAGAAMQKGTTVALVVGRTGNLIPNVQGMTEQEARAALAKVPGIEKILVSSFRTSGDETSDQKLAGRVFKSAPGAGQSLQAQEKTIYLYIYKYVSAQEKAALNKAVKMPQLVNLTREQAAAELKKIGIGESQVKFIQDSIYYTTTSAQAGKIASHAPAQGSPLIDPPKTTVLLYPYLLKGVDIRLPHVVMQSEAAAAATLKALGFAPKVEHYQEPNRALWDKVIHQTPPTGTIGKKGDVVTLRVAQPAGQVPALYGLTQADAAKSLNSAGLKIVVKDQKTAVTSQAERVLKQEPAVGAKVSPGSSVTVYIGRLALVVPNLRNLTEAQVRQVLQSRNLKTLVVYRDTANRLEAGKVFEFTPAYQTEVKSGDTVSVHIGRMITATPNLVGKTEQEARAILASVRMKVGRVLYQRVTASQRGKVIAQSLPAGRPPQSDYINLIAGK